MRWCLLCTKSGVHHIENIRGWFREPYDSNWLQWSRDWFIIAYKHACLANNKPLSCVKTWRTGDCLIVLDCYIFDSDVIIYYSWFRTAIAVEAFADVRYAGSIPSRELLPGGIVWGHSCLPWMPVYKAAYMSRVYFDFCLKFIITRPRGILFMLIMTVLVVHAQSKMATSQPWDTVYSAILPSWQLSMQSSCPSVVLSTTTSRCGACTSLPE